jgi:phospholipid/cholesterol/gamma-HCH transport system permease protein
VPSSILYVAEIGGTAYRALSSCLWERGRGRGLVRRVFLQQVYFTAVQALPLALFMAVGFGALLMIQASRQLPRFGMQEVEEITGLVLFREVAPLAVALIVIARSATAIVVEIGNMRVSGELRALEILGINLDRLIVLPRLLGMLVSVPLLATCFCAAALWGGYFLARGSGLLETNFVLQRLTTSLDVPMVEAVLIRSVCFGLITGAVSCGHGLRVKLSPTEVPQQATRGVVGALTLCFLANLVLSLRGY